MKKLFLTENEKKNILKLYGVINEQEGSDPKNPDAYPDQDEFGPDDAWDWEEWKIYFESLIKKYGEEFAKKRFLKYWEVVEEGTFVRADNNMDPNWFKERKMWNEKENRPYTKEEFINSKPKQIVNSQKPIGVSDKLIEFVKKEEFFVPCVYDDKNSIGCLRNEMNKCCLTGKKPKGIATIGYGTTYYPNDKRVTPNDPNISKETATEYLKIKLNKFAKNLLNIYPNLTQNQLDGLTSLCYNVGFAGCTKKAPKLSAAIKKNPDSKSNPKIKPNFLDFANLDRRKKEFSIYHDSNYA